MLTLTSTLRSSLSRTELEDFVVPVRVTVRADSEETGEAYTVGRIGMDRIMWGKARDLGQSLFEVCDCDSQGMYEMHAILTDGTDDIRADFGLDGPTAEVLFVHRVVLHPDLLPFRAAVLSAATALHAGLTLTTIWQGTGGVTDPELYHLGFRKVAGQPLFVHHWTFPSQFEDAHPGGMEEDFQGTPEHERWFRAAWKRGEV